MSQKEKNKTPPELDDQLEEAAAKEAELAMFAAKIDS